MQDMHKKKKRTFWIASLFIIWLVMNIRVAAGIGSTFERAVDGLVGAALLVALVFLALDFFQVIKKKGEGKGR